ncbi:MAG: tRNA (5-methylaminomethyl-2-thiouridine)(34)-methyltransferase MnmD [Pseudomonadota bacterium]
MASDEAGGQIETSEILWAEDGAPRSARYDDVFFSAEDGLAESRHVFHAGVGLEARLAASSAWAPLRLGEIGFGFGLNFLGAWAALDAAREGGGGADEEAALAYVGIERSPPNADEIRRALAPWPELYARREALLARWPLRSGETVALAPGLSLTLLVGEASVETETIAPPCGAWWLDGFSPAKNPDAWAPPLLAAIYERTEPGGALATYAAAGWVRRGLQAAGFEVTRRSGFGRKKEMLTALRPAGGGQARKSG